MQPELPRVESPRRRRRPAAGAGRRPPCRSRPCAAAAPAARPSGSRSRRSRAARRPRAGCRARAARRCAGSGSHSGKPDSGAMRGHRRYSPRVGGRQPAGPARYGLVARSRPIVVCGPCPGSTTTSSRSGRHLAGQAVASSWRCRRRAGRCGRCEPANSRSPESITSGTRPRSVVRQPERDRPRRVPGRVVDRDLAARRCASDLAVGQRPHVVGLGPLQPAAEHRLRLGARARPAGRRASARRPGGCTPGCRARRTPG